jgi:hypothetical protein
VLVWMSSMQHRTSFGYALNETLAPIPRYLTWRAWTAEDAQSNANLEAGERSHFELPTLYQSSMCTEKHGLAPEEPILVQRRVGNGDAWVLTASLLDRLEIERFWRCLDSTLLSVIPPQATGVRVPRSQHAGR